jgi:hypothetical protein
LLLLPLRLLLLPVAIFHFSFLPGFYGFPTSLMNATHARPTEPHMPRMRGGLPGSCISWHIAQKRTEEQEEGDRSPQALGRRHANTCPLPFFLLVWLAFGN